MHECRRRGAIILRYLGKISGLLLDRIDLHIEDPLVAHLRASFNGKPGCHLSLRPNTEMAGPGSLNSSFRINGLARVSRPSDTLCFT